MRFYAPIRKVDTEQRLVFGYASTEAEDADGETITLAALHDALDGYRTFSNLREMHQLSAIGRVEEADIDDKGLYVGARVVDDVAWRKVTSGVYQGFSVGGKATARDPANRKIITALTINEISLVDRPANPEAVFDCWKADGVAATIDTRTLAILSEMTADERDVLLIKATLRRPVAVGSAAVRRHFWGKH